MSEHRAKVYYASALSDASGTLKDREAAARLDEDYRKQKAANAEWTAKVAGLYAEKDALEFTRSVWQTENANNRRPL
jgi:hypothetical protein